PRWIWAPGRMGRVANSSSPGDSGHHSEDSPLRLDAAAGRKPSEWCPESPGEDELATRPIRPGAHIHLGRGLPQIPREPPSDAAARPADLWSEETFVDDGIPARLGRRRTESADSGHAADDHDRVGGSDSRAATTSAASLGPSGDPFGAPRRVVVGVPLPTSTRGPPSVLGYGSRVSVVGGARNSGGASAQMSLKAARLLESALGAERRGDLDAAIMNLKFALLLEPKQALFRTLVEEWRRARAARRSS
ncbi:MAG: hypothetical protein AAFZ18_22485, partial [Myxococcota bacterium]